MGLKSFAEDSANPSNKTPSQENQTGRAKREGLIFWLTGLSGAGKSTLANCLEEALLERGELVYILDGDKIRTGLNSDLGYSAEDRSENIRRITEVAQLFYDAGFFVIVAFISPFRKDREKARNTSAAGKFIEIFVDCSLEVCEKRDNKGLYKKARSGLVPDFTGISSPYEAPLFPEIRLKTDTLTVKECIDQILSFLEQRQFS